MAWPIQVARKAPTMPSTVVRMKPVGLLGPGESIRARMPATKPTMMIQIIPPMARVLSKTAGSDRHFVRIRQPPVRRQLVYHVGQMLAQALEQIVARQPGLRSQCVDLI